MLEIQPDTNVANNLESLVDNNGLAAVVNALAVICLGKAQHLEENWQDPNTARDYTRAATLLETAARKLVSINRIQFTRDR